MGLKTALLSVLGFVALTNASVIHPRTSKPAYSQYYNKKTSPYYVPSTGIPEVSFDIGESYAGQIPVDWKKTGSKDPKFFYWFFPTVNPAGKDDVVIWFNGGPGCSSLEGLTQENGPFSWKYGTYKPVPNAWSWHKLANVIWVEYPIGTGFSTGHVTAKNNTETAAQFVEWWKNLVDTFGLQGKKLYITGESYAGVYVPYVGAAMLDKKDTKYYNVKGALYYDPVMPYADKLRLDHAAFPGFFRHWESVFAIPDKNKKILDSDNEKCGLDKYREAHLTYPPPPAPWKPVQVKGCDITAHFDEISTVINPCFNVYHVQDTCPVLWDVLGFPSVQYTPPGATLFFNIPGVRKAIHAPAAPKEWASCSGPVFVGDDDRYDPAEHEKKFQTLVEKTNNVMIGSGMADYIITSNTTALAVQGLKWNGKQGFQTAPSAEFVVPIINNTESNVENWAGGSVQGSVHSERGFTLATVKTSGHMVPHIGPRCQDLQGGYIRFATNSNLLSLPLRISGSSVGYAKVKKSTNWQIVAQVDYSNIDQPADSPTIFYSEPSIGNIVYGPPNKYVAFGISSLGVNVSDKGIVDGDILLAGPYSDASHYVARIAGICRNVPAPVFA
ncbi:serine-type carboxypeptidase [Fusarium denticulatum]|uniref:Carboxypeptidase n=1 Tax=Fusarium denticulatum TaxID=48507 RepID=A0A8H5TJB6_9HYPO|nr:serine-type carboxypeptidase [Fusarium denticulatum]